MEAVLYKEADGRVDYTPTTAKTGGEVINLADGRAGVVMEDIAAAALGAVQTRGIYEMAKTADVCFLDGQKLFWDAANNKLNYYGDFVAGRAHGDATAAATVAYCELNVMPQTAISLDKGEWIKGAIDGLGVTDVGLAKLLAFDAVAEAAMAAIYSRKTVALAKKPILEGWLAVFDIGNDAALDISAGLANGSHDTDFDSVTEFVGIHLDGSALSILAESDDGTTEVAATDTTVDAVDDTPFFLQIDCRDLADIQIYINGVNVLPASVFKLDAATGPVFPIVHIEKTSNDTLADVRVIELGVRLAEAA